MIHVPVHTHTTRNVPYDAGGKPDGWDKLTPIQKDWVLSWSRRNATPVWAVMDGGVPSDKAIIERDRKDSRIIAAGMAVAVLAIAVLVYWMFKPDCWWPVPERIEWRCQR